MNEEDDDPDQESSDLEDINDIGKNNGDQTNNKAESRAPPKNLNDISLYD